MTGATVAITSGAERDQGHVLQIKKQAKNDLHPTMKPVELV
jgi:DNA modification methylase